MKKTLLILILLVMTSSLSEAKKKTKVSSDSTSLNFDEFDKTPNSAFIGIGLDLLLPRGEAATKNDDFGFAFDINGGYQFEGLPLIVGAEFLYGAYTGDYRGYGYYNSWSNHTFDISSESSVVSLVAYLRFQSDGKYFQPYIEILGGFKVLWTDTEFDYGDDYDDLYDDSESNAEFADFTSTYGFGCGALIPLISSMSGKKGMFLDLNFKYMFGGEAEYIKKFNILNDYGDDNYVTGKSRTDAYFVRLGVAFRF